MNVNEPMDFEPAEVINDLPPDQGGLRPMPAGSVAAEVVEVQAAVEQDPDDAIEDARDDRGRFQRGRRAPSHDARPDDAPRISKLSADLRETRVELALERGLRDVDAILDRVYPKATADERQKQRKHVEAQVAAYRPIAPTVDTAPVAMPAALPPAATAEAFSEPEPTLEQFASEPDPYQAHVRALGRWDAKKEAFEQARAAKASERTAAEAKQKGELAAIGQRWNARVTAAKAADASWEAAVTPVDAQIAGDSVLAYAILLDEDGTNMLKFLATQQELLDELILANPPVTDAAIAAMRRRLHSRMQAGTSGAAAPTKPVTPLSRPPTPVRTITTVPSDDAADPDDFDAFSERRRLERKRAAR